MVRNLKLTSPHMKGDDVTYAQKLLSSKGFYHSAIDGEYGPLTAGAVVDAKKSFGYLSLNINNVFDSKLEGYLTGSTKSGPLMKARTALVAKAQGKVNKNYEQVINVALSQAGVKENPPESNNVLFSRWYGVNGPWCAMFVTWCASQVGSKSFAKGKKYCYVPYIVADAKQKKNGLSITNNPVKGTVVTFDWQKDGTPDHVGFFIEWANAEKTSFWSVEGNTSSDEKGNQSNGGEVCKKLRYVTNVYHFVNWS